MPFKARRPIGGFKVMYEYANRLSELGYSIHITYPIQTKYMEYRLPYLVRKVLSYIEGFRTNKWFNFHDNITMSYVDKVCDKSMKDADVVIATWWTTVIAMGKLATSKGAKINLVQGYENWIGHEDELHSSYDIPSATNVVVASYLRDIVQKYTSNETVLIPNAIDSDVYNVINSIDDRKSRSICMLYSVQEIKGSEYGIKALKLLKKKYPDLTVELFGICPSPENLPDWITFYRNPKDLNALYNRNAIFLSNSLTEGMALTPMEAMFCGCACILTDIAGHSEYGLDNNTALLYSPQNIEQLAEKIEYLLLNEQERIRIAKQGNSYIQQFSWNVAVDKMDKVIKKILNKSDESIA